MNMSTTVDGVNSGRVALVSTCFWAWPLYSWISRAEVASSRRLPGCSTFIISRPRVAAIAMLTKKRVNVRPASGPRCDSSPS